MNPEIENAIRVVAEFDGWEEKPSTSVEHCYPGGMREVTTLKWFKGDEWLIFGQQAPPTYDTRDAIIEVAKKLETTWKREWGYKVVYALGRDGVQFHEILTASPETLLALAATITEMKGEKE